MMSASVEIILLLLAAGLVGTLAGIGVGQVVSSGRRRRRTRDNLRRRLVDTHRTIVMLERTVTDAARVELGPDEGTKLSARIAVARGQQRAEEPESARRP
jgi:hypothetical protein